MTAEWRWWPDGHETVRVLAEMGAGPTATAQIVVPSRGTVESVPGSSLHAVASRPWGSVELVWRAAAARAIAALAPPGAAATHNLNRPGFDGGSEPTGRWDRASTEEVPPGAA